MTDHASPGGPAPAAADPTATAGLERSIARVLTIGTYVAVGLLAIGLVLMLAHGTGPLSGGPAFDPGNAIADVIGLRPAGFIWIGLLVVVGTPAARVAASLIGYARRGERLMTGVSALILIVIAASVALAKGLEG